MDDGSAHRASPVGCTAPAMASTDAPIETQMESHRDMTTHKGECFCGAVRIEVTGTPEGMGYCHCRSCRSWSAGPVNAFALWKTDAVRSHRRRGAFGRLPEDTHQRASLLQNLRRSRDEHACSAGIDRRIRSQIADTEVRYLRRSRDEHACSAGIDRRIRSQIADTEVRSPTARELWRDSSPDAHGLPKLKDFPRELGGSGEQIAD